jgi:agmatine/peptidylarginine deiminase
MPTRLPAEWEPQSGIMLTWPHQATDWHPILAEVEHVFVELSVHITRFEKLLIVCFDQPHLAHVQQLLEQSDTDMSRVLLRTCKSNDSWARDHGPVTLYHDDTLQLVDFRFNGWGNKHPADLDNAINRCLFEQGTFKTQQLDATDFVLEGGSIESDGQGTLLTTTTCLLSPHRNPALSRSDIEDKLKRLLGFERILWLEHGALEGDDTDSHIDTLARFCDAQTIMVQTCDDPEDSHYPSLQAMLGELRRFKTAQGEPYQLVELPLPGAIHDAQGQRLPASYANFLILNQAVLLPVYADPVDERVIEIFKATFTDRQIIPVNARALIQQYGSIHCLTMQLPAGVL